MTYWKVSDNWAWLVDEDTGKLYYSYCRDCGKDKAIQKRDRSSINSEDDPDGLRYCLKCDVMLCARCFILNSHKEHWGKNGWFI